MHDNGEIQILVLNNNTSPQGLVDCASTISWHDRRREQVLEDEHRADGKGGLGGLRCVVEGRAGC